MYFILCRGRRNGGGKNEFDRGGGRSKDAKAGWLLRMLKEKNKRLGQLRRKQCADCGSESKKTGEE